MRHFGYMLLSSAVLALLSACASAPPSVLGPTPVPPPDTVPSSIRKPPPRNLRLAEARDHLREHDGAPVRWGGVIVATESDAQGTRIEVQQHALDGFGQPEPASPSEGRFLVQADARLDPATYARGREITVAGVLQGKTAKSIERPFSRLPVVQARDYRLWASNDKWDYGYREWRRYRQSCCYPRYYHGYPYDYGWYPYGYYYYPYPGFSYGIQFGFGRW